MLVREVMTQAVVTAAAGTAAREVAEIMRERNVGAVVLLAGDGTPAAVLTDRDLALAVVAEGRDAAAPAEAHASSPVVCGEPAMALVDAAELMARFGIRRLPVLEGGRLVGIVTLDDIAVRTADPELQASLTRTITRGSLPGFYFHHRGG
jgi:CBS domain-containing protein